MSKASADEIRGWLRSGEIFPDRAVQSAAQEDPRLAEKARQVEACFSAYPEVLELILDITLRRAPVDMRLDGAQYRQFAQLRCGQNQVAATLIFYLETAERNRTDERHRDQSDAAGGWWGRASAGDPGPGHAEAGDASAGDAETGEWDPARNTSDTIAI